MTGNVAAVFLFEWRRALTLPRMAWWALLAAFPAFIIALIRFTALSSPPRDLWAGTLYALVPMLVSMLGTLLWATPAVSSELERRSWVYLAVRPHGGVAVLLGKYLGAVTWVVSTALVGLTMAVLIADSDDGWRLWWTMARLACLACPAYGAVYLLIGTVLPRRAMVLAVAYTLIFELVVGLIPAVVNKLTVQYRLRALLVEWCDLEIPGGRQSGALALIGDAPPWQHIVILMFLTAGLLFAATLVLRWSEFASSAETDV